MSPVAVCLCGFSCEVSETQTHVSTLFRKARWLGYYLTSGRTLFQQGGGCDREGSLSRPRQSEFFNWCGLQHTFPAWLGRMGRCSSVGSLTLFYVGLYKLGFCVVEGKWQLLHQLLLHQYQVNMVIGVLYCVLYFSIGISFKLLQFYINSIFSNPINNSEQFYILISFASGHSACV